MKKPIIAAAVMIFIAVTAFTPGKHFAKNANQNNTTIKDTVPGSSDTMTMPMDTSLTPPNNNPTLPPPTNPINPANPPATNPTTPTNPTVPNQPTNPINNNNPSNTNTNPSNTNANPPMNQPGTNSGGATVPGR